MEEDTPWEELVRISLRPEGGRRGGDASGSRKRTQSLVEEYSFSALLDSLLLYSYIDIIDLSLGFSWQGGSEAKREDR